MAKGDIIRSVWTYNVDGRDQGTYTETYARGMYETLAAHGANVRLVRIDHVAADFQLTGRNWDSVRNVVAGSAPKTPGELAAELAWSAYELADPYGSKSHTSPYYQDAAHLLLEALTKAKQEGRLGRVTRGFRALADREGHRVHRLLLSLKQGRQNDVLDALMVYGF